MKNGCLKCLMPNASGGGIEAWKRRGVELDLTVLHTIQKYEICKCNQCNNHFIYNGKIFDSCVSSHIPALLNWSESLNFYDKNKEVIRPIFENKVFDTLYSGKFEISYSGKVETGIILIYDSLISSNFYDPLKPIPINANIKFLRLNKVEEISNKETNKFLVRHNEFT